jgi:hypothetical protein
MNRSIVPIGSNDPAGSLIYRPEPGAPVGPAQPRNHP